MEHDIEFADVRNLGFSTVAPASSRARRARVAVAAAVTLSRSLPHYSLTLTTTNHSQNTTLHSDTHDPFFESEPKGITHQATQDQPSRRTQAAHLLCPAQSKTSSPSVRYSAARRLEAACDTAPPHAPHFEDRRQCLEHQQASVQSRRLTRALSAREGQQRENRKLTKYYRPVRRSG